MLGSRRSTCAEVLAREAVDAAHRVLTSATIPPQLPSRLGAPRTPPSVIDVGSPFDYEDHALLYCAAHLPDPRRPGYEAALHDELEALIDAAGGRTLALFTSWRAMQAAAAELAPATSGTRSSPRTTCPSRGCSSRFTDDDAVVPVRHDGLLAGHRRARPSLSLVTIDRLPFPRPDDPLLQARRARGADAFAEIDLPSRRRAARAGAGRLIRTATDRGVVAVLDPRLANAGYRWDIVRALPPMRRTRHRDEAETFLRALR